MKIIIICHSFLSADGRTKNVGGVETYVQFLLDLSRSRGWSSVVFQKSDTPFNKEIEPGLRVLSWCGLAELSAVIDEYLNGRKAVVIYSDYHCTPERLHHPCVMIQHGVGWDYSATRLEIRILQRLNKLRKRWNRFRLFAKLRRTCLSVDKVVCVDTTFRTFMQSHFPFDSFRSKLEYIPNCARPTAAAVVDKKWGHPPKHVRVLFPRRFAEIRGALVFAEIVRDVAIHYEHVSFAFVGVGECQSKMEAILNGVPRVSIYSRDHSSMQAEYEASHLVIIPTLASEGTSLSCVEAMSAGCAVIATDIGGLGNLILPGFNGLLCQPTKTSIQSAVIEILDDQSLMQRLAVNAYLSASQAFNIDSWRERMSKAIESVYAKYP